MVSGILQPEETRKQLCKFPLKAPEKEEDETSVDALVVEVLLELDGKL